MERQSTARLGRYELLRELGAGGAAVVWEALLHGPLGFRKPVALKVISARSTGDRYAEARLGARLQHPNVVATYAVEEIDGRCCIAMELIRGASARQLLDGGPLPVRAVVELGIQAADGLAHVHASGLVHRDVKPANLLIADGGTVKLTDLGVARPTGGEQGASGTFGYMPAEQCDGRATPASDVFALGATLYRLVADQPLFGRGQVALAYAATADAHLERTGALDAVPHAGLRAVIARAVRQRPEDRYPSVDAMRDALTALIDERLTGERLVAVLAARADPTAPHAALPEPEPTAIVRLLGRDRLLSRLRAALRRGRWVTLHGPGGVGKSALAAALAQQAEAEGPVLYIEADGVDDALGLAGAVAVAAGARLPSGSPADALQTLLSGREGVVVLDGVERLDGWAQLVASLLASGAARFLVATQAVPLELHADEQRFEVPPLAPEAAAALFCQRAGVRAIQPERLAPLEGLPLAIELAAARRRGRGSAASEPGGRPARHGSLVASLDATVALLPPWGAEALAQLSSFASGFPLEAAAGVLAVDGPPPIEVLERLQALALLQVDRARQRYRISGLVRRFAVHRAPEAAQLGRERHAVWYAQLGAPATLAALGQAEQSALRERVSGELPELAVATRWAIEAGRADAAHACALAAAWVYAQQGPFPEANAVLRRAAALQGRRQAEVLVRLGYFLLVGGEVEEGGRVAAQAVALAEAVGDAHTAAKALLRLGQARMRDGQLREAAGVLQRALDIFERHGDAAYRGSALLLLGSVQMRAGRLDDALRTVRRCARLLEAVGVLNSAVVAWGNLGMIQTAVGDDAGALRSITHGRDLARTMDYGRFVNSLTVLLAEVHVRAGDLDAAESELDLVELRLEDVADPLALGRSRVVRGTVLEARGQLAAAADVLREGIAILTPVDTDEAQLARVPLARVLHARGDGRAALRELAEALRVIAGPRWRFESAEALAEVARIRRSPAELERARALVDGHRVHPSVTRAIERAAAAIAAGRAARDD